MPEQVGDSASRKKNRYQRVLWSIWSAVLRLIFMIAGLLILLLIVFLISQGVERADQWASIFGLFVSLAGLVIAASQARGAASVRHTASPPTSDAEITVDEAETRKSSVVRRRAIGLSLSVLGVQIFACTAVNSVEPLHLPTTPLSPPLADGQRYSSPGFDRHPTRAPVTNSSRSNAIVITDDGFDGPVPLVTKPTTRAGDHSHHSVYSDDQVLVICFREGPRLDVLDESVWYKLSTSDKSEQWIHGSHVDFKESAMGARPAKIPRCRDTPGR
ncbi:hypothetical protein [Actinoplanes sp. ATCC 53533]|uniref:hypothetical protein n=1 Tax=Actinoplanes sp. ATCC 53533 TaxID=1288362 RepID=UPI000F76E684|nr:hypothetical protein [Actinoplanes sp. ATCC 53533]